MCPPRNGGRWSCFSGRWWPKTRLGGVIVASALSCGLTAQLPSVEWLREHAVPERPPGLSYIWNSGTQQYDFQTLPLNTNVPQAESSIDWFNDVCLVRDANGVHIGYAVAGYSYIPNYFFNDGPCPATGVTPSPPLPLYMETFEKRWGYITGTVAYYDLNGQRQWYHTYTGGAFFGIIQDKNGDLVVCGVDDSIGPWPGVPWSAQPVLYNPVNGQIPHDMLSPGCTPHAKKMVLMKVRLSDGHALWNHVYSMEDDPAQGRMVTTLGYSLVEVDPDAGGGYRAVGYWVGGVGHPTLAGRQRPFMIDVDVNGMLNWKQVFDGNHPAQYWNDGNPLGSTGLRIVRHPDPTVDQYVITGYRIQNLNVPVTTSAFLLYYNNNSAVPAFWEDTAVNSAEYGLSNTSRCAATRAAFAVSGGVTTIVWPVLTDFVGSITAAVNHQATGRVYHMDLSGNQLWSSPANLGAMRGFDLYFSANQRANGNVVVGCTKSSKSTTPLVFTALPAGIQNCLQTTYGYDPLPPSGTLPDPFNWTVAGSNEWGHWLSDSYMAELDLNTGSVLWQGTWDADVVQGTTPICAPDNIRQRQCSFNVIEADDGGLVGCGNTGRSIEDSYLVKFSGCESNPALYTAFHTLYPYNPSNVYTLTATNTTWGQSMNVRGSIVVPAGKTLTINNNAVIGFADSRKVGYTTNIVVQPGGKLFVMGGARLTNIGPCGDGMWDGIMALGTTNQQQTLPHQSEVQVTSGATIENAFVAVLAANADINDPVNSPATQRGARVICTNATFKNNIYDVVLRPYNCGSVCANDFTVTKFHNCDFLTTGPLNYADRTPKTHLYVNAYPRTWVRGCTFDGAHAGLVDANVAAWGKGIVSFNTDLRIDPLNGEDPHFNSLESACFATNAPSAKTVRVNGAFFDGNGHGLGIVSAGTAHVVNCDFKEPDLDMVGQGLGAPVYGTYLEETPTILFEHNAFWNAGTGDPLPYDNPNVGSTFKDIGGNSNRFFDNSYYGFRGGGGGTLYSAATTIQGVNDGGGIGDGLQFKCNQFSFQGPGGNDDFDLAFTGPGVSVGDRQGAATQQNSPAGNTFLMNCTGESHMKVDDVPNNTGLFFQYYHHAPTAGVEVVPTCLTNPPLIPSGLGTINQPTLFVFNREVACGEGAMMMMASGGANAADAVAHAASELNTLKAVYDDWTDGGDTEGLSDFVANPANTSYQVRNQLMLVAPKVSSEVWKLVFERTEEMNPWHMAQALIANSPLEPEVYRMMDQSYLTPYYKQLVANEQDGMNMQTIMESELAYWQSEQAEALKVYASLAMDEQPAVTFAEAIALYQEYPIAGSSEQIHLLRMAAGDLSAARAELDQKLAGVHSPWWELQNIHLSMLESGAEAPTAAQVITLEGLAASEGPGAIAARAWLAQINGEAVAVKVILPGAGTRSFLGGRAGRVDTAPVLLGIYPNPTQGQAYITCQLPEGADQGELVVLDPTGRLVLSKTIQPGVGIIELPRAQLNVGAYVVTLKADGTRVANGKFIVQR